MQHDHQPFHRLIRSRRAAFLAVMALLGWVTFTPVNADNGDPASEETRIYAGIFLGSAVMANKIVDVEGFANWGQPGYTLGYGDNRLVGGALLGTKVGLGGVRLRIEFDGMVGDLSGKSNRLDPAGLDETAGTVMQWIATGRVGFEVPVRRATIFAATGLAATRMTNFVTDIDSDSEGLPHLDPDDSFRAGSVDLGPVIGAGVEAPLTGAWNLRVEGSFLDFGWSTHAVNHSGNNRCGPENPRRPCPYDVRNRLGVIRFGLVYSFGR